MRASSPTATSKALKALIDKKAKSKTGKKILEDVDDPTGGKGGSNVIDLMAALKKSVGEKAPAKKAASAKKTATAKKPAAKRKSA